MEIMHNGYLNSLNCISYGVLLFLFCNPKLEFFSSSTTLQPIPLYYYNLVLTVIFKYTRMHRHPHRYPNYHSHQHTHRHVYSQQDLNTAMHSQQMNMMRSKTIKHEIQDNKHNVDYQRITKAIDRHNTHAANQLKHTAHSQHCRSSGQLGINDQLITMYTDAVYERYCIPKPIDIRIPDIAINSQFANQQSNGQGHKIMNIYRTDPQVKQLKLKAIVRKNKHNIMSSPQLDLLASPPVKRNKCVPIKQINLNINQSSNNTPVKPKIQGIKKSGMSTTAGSNFSHGRSKTGRVASTTQNTHQGNQQNDGSQTHRTANNPNSKQQEVLVSEFGSGWLEQQNQLSLTESEIKNQSMTKQIKHQTQLHALTYNPKFKCIRALSNQKWSKIKGNNNLTEPCLNQNHCKSCLCPICQQEVNAKQIYDHEEDCKGLKQLYELSYEKLIEFVNWKIKNHKGNIIQLLNMNELYCEDAQSALAKNKENNDEKLQKISNDLNGNSYKYYGNMPTHTKQMIGQCNEYVSKCCWFQIVKKNLLSMTDTIM